MRWCVIRHPDLGTAVVAELSLVAHRPRGWVRVSGFVDNRDDLNTLRYKGATDHDAEGSAPADAPTPTEPDAGQDPPAKTPKTTKAPAGERAN